MREMAALHSVWRDSAREPASSATPDDNRMIARANILGAGVSAINLPIAVDTMAQWIAACRQNYVCVTGVHGLMESHRDPELRAIHNRAGMASWAFRSVRCLCSSPTSRSSHS